MALSLRQQELKQKDAVLVALQRQYSNLHKRNFFQKQPTFHAEKLLMEAELASIMEQRNSLTWLCYIPRELLAAILLEVQIDDDVDAEEKEICSAWWTGINNDWIVLMAVCKHIREVALACPSLWAHLQIGNGRQDWNKLCIERAGQHLLDLHAFIGWDSNASRKGSMSRLCELISNSRRVRLNIRDYDHHDRKFIKHLFNHHFLMVQPHLEHLEIFSFAENYRPLIREGFLGGQPNQLRSLLLTHFWVQTGTEIPRMPSLERLVLREIKRGPFFETLRQLLEKTPVLTFLCIEDCTPAKKYARNTSTTDTSANQKKVSLPRLSTLQLHGSVVDLRGVLQFLPDPSRELLVYESANGESDDFFIDVDIRRINHPERRADSQYLMNRIIQFLRDAAQKKLLARHLFSDYRTITSVSSQAWVMQVFSDEEHPASHQKFVDVRLCFACDDRPDTLVHNFLDISLAVEAVNLAELSPLLGTCAGLTILNIDDLRYSFRHESDQSAELRSDGQIELIEKIMRERCMRQLPLNRITITRDKRYLRFVPDQLSPHEYLEGLEAKWKMHGWVEEVVWFI